MASRSDGRSPGPGDAARSPGEGGGPPDGEARRYRVYGLVVESDFPFRTPLPETGDAPDLSFRRVWDPPVPVDWRDSEPAFESRYLDDLGRPRIRLHRLDGLDVFRHAGVADYYVGPDGIVCHQHDSASTPIVEVYFLSLLAGFWLETHGRLVLHGSAVSIGDRAAVFLATNTGGKTSLAASLMRLGHPLLTDDFLAVSLDDGVALGFPSFPQMRMWPDLADHFADDHRDLPRVLADTEKRRVPVGTPGIGAFCPLPRPLARLYVPFRRPAGEEGPVRIEPLSPREALLELLRESFLRTILERTGLHERRFARLAELARLVPMARLDYPSGLDRLPDVSRTIVADVSEGGA
ncbi:MAG: hypothetical protein R6X22_02270 [Gemmatimonadota bacterium]